MPKLFTILYYTLALAALSFGALLVLLQTDIVPGYEVRIVQSGSMAPAITTGSVVIIEARERYEVDDVITFGGDTPGSLPTTHRVMSDIIVSGELAYTTKGDANDSADVDPVRLSEVRGAVLLSIPYLGYLLDFARQPLGFALLIGVPALLIAVEEISAIYQAIRGRQEDEEVETVTAADTKQDEG